MFARDSEPQWFGHPRGLTILFLTEMWEKFSYYGMRSILIYYMTRQLLIEQSQASLIYGLYTAFIVFTPLPGGFLTDRWIGNRRAVIIGGLIMALGHFMMASEALFLVALATIVIGNGLYLPSLPSQISSLYRPDDPRRTNAYTIYYVGINVGGFFAPLVCGALGEIYGWHYGFAAAGVGMLIGLCTYVAGGRYLPSNDSGRITDTPKATGDFKQRFVLLIAIAGAVIIFRGAYEQLGNTVALWAEAFVDRRLTGGWNIPFAWFQSLNPFFIFLFTPIIIPMWTMLARRGREPSSLVKMTVGAAIVGASYLMLAVLTPAVPGNNVHWLWFTGFFVLLTLGELLILPVGLSLFGRWAPAHLTATTIATWFCAGFAGNLFAGWLGSLMAGLGYSSFFVLIGGVAVTSGALLLLLVKPARRFEHG